MIVGVRVGGSVGLGVAEGLGASVRVGAGEGLGETVAVGDGTVQPANPMNKVKIKPKMGVFFIIAFSMDMPFIPSSGPGCFRRGTKILHPCRVWKRFRGAGVPTIILTHPARFS